MFGFWLAVVEGTFLVADFAVFKELYNRYEAIGLLCKAESLINLGIDCKVQSDGKSAPIREGPKAWRAEQGEYSSH
jgi:hypothetical protein